MIILSVSYSHIIFIFGRTYIKYIYGDFIKKINNLDSIPENAILVTADVMGIYPSIPHEAMDKRDEKTIPMEELLKMAEFVLKNNYFEFGNKIK